MTQKVIALVNVLGQWRLKTPSGTLFDAYFRGTRVEAIEWGTNFISSWVNTVLEEEQDEKQDSISKQTF